MAIAGKIAGNLVRLGRGLRDAALDVLVNIGFQIYTLLCDPIPMTCRPCSLLHAHGPLMSDTSTQSRVAHCARCCTRITPLIFEMPSRRGMAQLLASRMYLHTITADRLLSSCGVPARWAFKRACSLLADGPWGWLAQRCCRGTQSALCSPAGAGPSSRQRRPRRRPQRECKACLRAPGWGVCS